MTRQIQQPFGILFIISGPSGAGKTTVLKQALTYIEPEVFLQPMITYTTRKPRPGDVQGVDYHFISEEEFQKRIVEDFFVEYSTSYGAYYGSPKSLLDTLHAGTSLITVLDYAGVKSFKKMYHAVVPIWLGVDQQTTLERLATRATESEEQLKLRLELSAREEQEEQELRIFQYRLINADVAETAKSLAALIRYELSCVVSKNVDN